MCHTRGFPVLISVLLIFVVFFAGAGRGRTELIHYHDAKIIRVAVYPFNDEVEGTLDHEIALLIGENLAEEKHIEVIPIDTIRQVVYSIEPTQLWTEKKDAKSRGGLLWDISPMMVEEVSASLTAQYSIYGNMVREKDTWILNAFISKSPREGDVKSFTIKGLQEKNIEERIRSLSQAIKNWLMEESVVAFAEEDIRRFQGGMSTHRAVLKEMNGYVDSYPLSIPLRSLLLDLYLRDKEKYTEEILVTGMKLSAMLEGASQSDIRYVLALSLDPYDAVAAVHEGRRKWEQAIAFRKKALDIFPYKGRGHKETIGRDYYHRASALEEKGLLVRAQQNYSDALSYLSSSDEYYEKAKDALTRLRYK